MFKAASVGVLMAVLALLVWLGLSRDVTSGEDVLIEFRLIQDKDLILFSMFAEISMYSSIAPFATSIGISLFPCILDLL